MDSVDSLRLIEALKKGDESACEQLIDSYLPKVVSFLRKFITAENEVIDMAQDVFIKLWLRRATVEVGGNLNALIFTIARHMAYDHLRKRKVRPKEMSLDEDQNLVREVDAQTNIWEETGEVNLDSLRLMHQLIPQLPPQQRKIISLRVQQNLSNKEIASQLGLSSHTVKNQYGNALRTLRKLMKGQTVYGIFLMLL